jgi:LPS export ABC transporter protein LptC
MRFWFFFIIGISLLFPSCETPTSDLAKVLLPPLANIEIGKDAVLYYSDSAQVKALIQTGELTRYLDKAMEKEEFNQGVIVDFFDGSGNVYSRLESQTGERFPSKNQVIVRDSVVFTNFDNGNKLESEELFWDQNKKIIYTDRFVKLTTQEDTILSFGFKADENFTWYELKSIQGVKNMEESPKNRN